jgi:hypothetical protein
LISKPIGECGTHKKLFTTHVIAKVDYPGAVNIVIPLTTMTTQWR